MLEAGSTKRREQEQKTVSVGFLLGKQLLFEAARQESVALRAAIAWASPDWRQALEEWEQLRHQHSTVALQSGSEARSVAEARAQGGGSAEMLSLRDRIEQLEQRLRRDNPAYACNPGCSGYAWSRYSKPCGLVKL